MKKGLDPNVSKSRLSKRQKEDKELEELSAFFSQKTSRREARIEEQDLVARGARLRSIPRDIEHPLRLTRRDRSGSSHGSQPSDRSITVGEAEGVTRYSSSLPAVRDCESGSITRSRASDRLDSRSAWSQQYDDRPMDVVSGSSSLRRAQIRRNVTEVLGHTSGHLREFEPEVVAKAGSRPPEKSTDAAKGTCKDAAAQTDLSPRAQDKPPCPPPQRPDESQRLVDHVHDELRCDAFVPFTGNTRKTSQSPIFVGEERWPVSKVSRNAPHIEPEVEYPLFDEARILGGGITTTRVRDAGSFLYPPTQATERPGGHVEPTRPSTTYESQPRTNHRGNIPDKLGFENLREFIRRIEDEAAMSSREVGDGPALRYGESGPPVPLGPPVLSRVANFDGAGDTTVLPNRIWFTDEPVSLGPDLVGNSTPVSQTGFGRPTSLSLLDSYSMNRHVEYPRTARQPGNML